MSTSPRRPRPFTFVQPLTSAVLRSVVRVSVLCLFLFASLHLIEIAESAFHTGLYGLGLLSATVVALGIVLLPVITALLVSPPSR